MNKSLSACIVISASMLSAGQIAAQKTPLSLSSHVFVERQVMGDNGKRRVILEQRKSVVPGDRLVFVLKYKNAGTKASNDFVVTNPMPRTVRFEGSVDGLELASVDGGKSWGFLSQLRVTTANGGLRHAVPSDVTHIKWKLHQTLAPGQGGKLVFRGVVK